MRLTTEQSLLQVKQHIQKLQAKFLKLVKILHVKLKVLQIYSIVE